MQHGSENHFWKDCDKPELDKRNKVHLARKSRHAPKGRRKVKIQQAHLAETSGSDSSSSETEEDDPDDHTKTQSRNWYGHDGQPQMPGQAPSRTNVGFIQHAEVVEYDAGGYGGPALNVDQSWMIHELLREREVTTDDGTETNVFFGRSDRIHGCESMLLDTGSFKNIVGDAWVGRMDQINKKAGIPTHTKATLSTKVVLGGVGTGAQESNRGDCTL